MKNINFEEERIINRILKRNQFSLNLDFLDKIIHNKSILILGASGSIAQSTISYLDKKNFYEMILIDKDENGLTKLSREISLNNKKKTKFLCFDINSPPKLFYKRIKNKDLIILNFAALKHVRSETFKESLDYMLMTNCISPFIIFDKLQKNNQISSFFSISTDKSNLPVNYMGASKRLTEYLLKIYKKKYNKTKISSTRFANVLFSNGSLTESIIDKIKKRQNFGVPKNSFRYFISKNESAQIVLASLSDEFDGFISYPKINIIGKPISLVEIVKRISLIFKININFVNEIEDFSKSKYKEKKIHNLQVLLSNYTTGEKKSESFKISNDKSFNTKFIELKKIKLPSPPLTITYKKIQNIIKSKNKHEEILNLIDNLSEFKHNKKKKSLFDII
tara:strand:+ start:3231 stop:4409 length:1179 start_codon:yes stop_codon:yes gene_type:complete